MKTITLTLLLTILTTGLFAQVFEVPENYKLEKEEDYAPYEQDVIDCIDWLMQTPLNEQKDKRKAANAFLLKWLTGSPYVHIEIKQEVVTFMGSTPELLMTFLGGWAKYSITTRDYDNKLEGSLAGIEAVIEFYTNNRSSIPKNKEVEKYIKRKKQGKLRDYLEKNV